MTLLLDQLVVRIDRGLEKIAASLEQRWDRKGDAPRSQRWGMRRPLLAPLTGHIVGLTLISGLEGLRVLGADGGADFRWPVVLLLAVIAAMVLPLQYRLQQHVGRRYDSWRQRQQLTPQRDA